MEYESNAAPAASLRPPPKGTPARRDVLLSVKGPASGSKLWGPVGQSMDKSLLEGTWQEFEALIRDTIGSDFRWRVRPQDTRSNRGYDSKPHPGRY